MAPRTEDVLGESKGISRDRLAPDGSPGAASVGLDTASCSAFRDLVDAHFCSGRATALHAVKSHAMKAGMRSRSRIAAA